MILLQFYFFKGDLTYCVVPCDVLTTDEIAIIIYEDKVIYKKDRIHLFYMDNQLTLC